MASDRQNLQDAFLNQVRKEKNSVTVFLINGVKLQGVITWFDNFCILLRRRRKSMQKLSNQVMTPCNFTPLIKKTVTEFFSLRTWFKNASCKF